MFLLVLACDGCDERLAAVPVEDRKTRRAAELLRDEAHDRRWGQQKGRFGERWYCPTCCRARKHAANDLPVALVAKTD